MSAQPVILKIAEAPAKDAMLALLNELRTAVENDETIGIISIAILKDRAFHVRSEGEVTMIQMVGYLGVAQLDAMRTVSS